MLQGWLVVLISFAYLATLFAIAQYAEKRAGAGRSVVANPYVYALSLTVYVTAWTFYGAVGHATTAGPGFLAIALGPALAATLWWFVLRKIIRIVRANRVTSIADLIALRYGNCPRVGGLVSVIAVVGLMPYVSIQLETVSSSFTMLIHYPEIVVPAQLGPVPVLADKAFYVAILMAAFTILFGTRHLDASERHEGLVAAVAAESAVKLGAFLAVGLFVTFGMYAGFSDLFGKAAAMGLSNLWTFGEETLTYGAWASLSLLSLLAVTFLPRQFQVAVVENVDETHLNKAVWLFPLYLLAINFFVLPIALAGLMRFPGGGVDPDTFVLALPMVEGHQLLALVVYLGGLSAATGMIIFETIALSTMVSNNLVMPALLRWKSLHLNERADLSGLVLNIRRGTAFGGLLLGYVYFRFAGGGRTLAETGLLSFAAVAQFAPALLGGLFWKNGSRHGALAGLAAGFAVWAYSLLLPSFAQLGWISMHVLEHGPLGIEFLRPTRLFGLEGMDALSHGLFWSLVANVLAYVGVSLASRQTGEEYRQAALFVDIMKRGVEQEGLRLWRGTASVSGLHALLGRFLGPSRADEALSGYARQAGVPDWRQLQADAGVVHFVETSLAGAIGAPSARIVMASAVKEEPLGVEEVMNILDETSQAIAYSRALEQKSRELEQMAAALRESEGRLQAILDNTTSVIFLKDTEGRYLLVNRRYEHLFHVTRDDIKGKTDFDLFPREQAEALRTNDRRALEAGAPLEFEEAVPQDDGVRTYLAVKFPLRDAKGAPYAICGIATDITERKRAEQEIRDAHARFSGILDIAADAIISVDENQRIILFNQGAEKIFGYRWQEVMGKPLDILLPPRFREVHRRDIVNFGKSPVVTRKMGERSEIAGLRRDGAEFPAEASISQLELKGGKVFTVMLRDITESKRTREAITALNRDLARRAAQLEYLNKELEAFSYSVSHDLRAPLRSIDGFSQALLEDYGDKLDETGKDYLRRVRAASQRMALLIDDILNLSRLTRGEMRRETVDLSALARAVAEELRESQPERKVEFLIEEGVTGEGDPRLLRVVLDNLLNNAWKYTSRHPAARIEFGAQRGENGRTVYFVRDDGAGFDMAYADRLFSAFQRLHSAEEFPGTGIGLATVQRIIHKHGGRVWAEGAVERGATFYFTLE